MDPTRRNQRAERTLQIPKGQRTLLAETLQNDTHGGMNDWRQLWKPTRDNQPMTRLPLQDQAKQQAAALPPLTFEQLGKTLKHLPDKACGPDAITTQLLRTAPKQALQPLLGILQAMEAKAELPTQLTNVPSHSPVCCIGCGAG